MGRENMRAKWIAAAAAVILAMAITGCSSHKAQTASFKDAVDQQMKDAGFQDVKVSEDRDKALITLDGMVRSEQEKQTAEDRAKVAAPGDIISNRLSIEPAGLENKAKEIESNVDQAIKDNYKAALIGNKLEDQNIKYSSLAILFDFPLVGNPNSRCRDEKSYFFCSQPLVGKPVPPSICGGAGV